MYLGLGRITMCYLSSAGPGRCCAGWQMPVPDEPWPCSVSSQPQPTNQVLTHTQLSFFLYPVRVWGHLCQPEANKLVSSPEKPFSKNTELNRYTQKSYTEKAESLACLQPGLVPNSWSKTWVVQARQPKLSKGVRVCKLQGTHYGWRAHVPE